MTDKQILETAIQKAIDGGWNGSDDIEHTARTAIEQYDGYRHVTDIIFSHDFAKSLWGEQQHSTDLFSNSSPDYFFNSSDLKRVTEPNWQYHIKQMVIAENPIAYIGENI